jgi:type 1 fimbria pilin
MRMKLTSVAVVALVASGLSTAAMADDLSGTDKFLCTVVQATRCGSDAVCDSGPPWKWNIPQFIEIDLTAKQMRTTKASGENRATPIKNLERSNGALALQGVEAGRAFSFVIVEETGEMSVAVATADFTTSVFGACTPLPAAR